MAGYVTVSVTYEAEGIDLSMSGMKINMKSCAPSSAGCDLLNTELTRNSEDVPEGMTYWISKCSFEKCDSDGVNCEALSEATYEDPSSAAAMSTLVVTLVALFRLF